MFLVLWGPLLVLAAVCVTTLNELPPLRRRGLFALLFGGAGVLRSGLAYLGSGGPGGSPPLLDGAVIDAG